VILLFACIRFELSPLPNDPHAMRITGEGEVVCQGADDSRSVTVEDSAVLRFLLADTLYRCTQGSFEKEVRTQALPEGMPLPTVSVPSEEAGYHLLYPHEWSNRDTGIGWLMVVDGLGRIRWQLLLAEELAMDLTWMVEGFFVTATDLAPQLLDLDGQRLWQEPWEAGSAYEIPESWNHDGAPTEDGSSVLSISKEQLPSKTDTSPEGFLIRETDWETRQLRWSWSSAVDGADRLKPLAHPEDPYHANTVIEYQDAILVNLRRTSQILKINHDTKKIEWILGDNGDFALLDQQGQPSEDWFEGPHDIKLIDGMLYLFDNRTSRQGSRILVLAIDESKRTAQLEREWLLEQEPPWYAPAWGGVDLLSDGTLSVAYGDQGDPDQPPAAVFLIDPDNRLRWRLDFPEGWAIYRSDWKAELPGL
jgi:hypothetical protein